jgi:hypothetical protein
MCQRKNDKIPSEEAVRKNGFTKIFKNADEIKIDIIQWVLLKWIT